MRLRNAFVRLAIASAVAGAGIVAVAQTAHAASSPVTSYSYASQAGDWVGQGATNSYTATTASIRLSGTAGSLRFQVNTASENWEVDLAAPTGAQLHAGSYGQAARAGFNGGQPGLAVFGDGRGCNTDTGSFVIRSIGANSAGTITELDASFVQLCDGSAASLTGRVQYQAPPDAAVTLTSSNPSTVLGQPVQFTAQVPAGSSGTVTFRDGAAALGSVNVDGAGLATLETSNLPAGTHLVSASFGGNSASATQVVAPNTTSYWFSSPAGDYIGAGASASFTAPGATLTLSGSTSSVTVAASSTTDDWSVTLAAPLGQTLAPGTYTGAERAAFQSGGAPGLDVGGDGRGCNNVAGTFTINRIAGNASAVTMLDATFAQNCEGTSAPPLRGWVRFRAPAASTTVLVAPANVNAGQSTPLSATVSGVNGPVSGSVTFSDGATTLGTVAVDPSGTAALTTTLPIGAHTVTATYSGSADYQPSSASAAVSVARYSTGATLAASPPTVKHGKPITLTVQLSGGPPPTGTVTFFSGSQSIGTASAVNGAASLTWTSQAKGSFAVSAAYAGDATHQSATSNTVIVKVT